ncbi:glycyl-radical enzyme activating protein [Anaeroselena agilis]|uniref:Glycyl-radical enzyme activating protein n=1 Tax=Anaeroselena agilis TaxID=3063788 RepID=A0ABU3P0M9_9FIRM|nr:glycyl-radical enzyme activating protein [Selenomonadales bacterium 4137-cl]
MSTIAGNIFQIQRWSVHDGEGIRSTVFFKGCPLRCRWCANPESWHGAPEVLFFHSLCSGCGRCVQACTSGAIAVVNGIARTVSPEKCRGCGKCCEGCPTGARKMMGKVCSVDDILRIIQRDAIFYRTSGGGVTFSGGEPFAQPEFLRQLAADCHRLGIDTAVETCGHFDWEQVKDIVALLDGVFVDIKHMDDAVHRRLTGVGNRLILENIALMSRLKPGVIVRVPLIAGVNDGERNIRAMGEFLQLRTRVQGVELLPYHDLGVGKWEAVGASATVFTAPDDSRVDAAKQIIASCGLRIVDYK